MSVLDFNQTFAEIRIPRSQLLRELACLLSSSRPRFLGLPASEILQQEPAARWKSDGVCAGRSRRPSGPRSRCLKTWLAASRTAAKPSAWTRSQPPNVSRVRLCNCPTAARDWTC